jgi:hypothetical protein
MEISHISKASFDTAFSIYGTEHHGGSVAEEATHLMTRKQKERKRLGMRYILQSHTPQ